MNHWKNILVLTPLLVIMVLFQNCAESKKSKSEDKDQTVNTVSNSRSFYLGFTPFPYDFDFLDINFTNSVLDYIYNGIAEDGDIISLHFDGGIPWSEALSNSYPYNNHLMDDWANKKGRVQSQLSNHKVFLSVTPLASSRSSFAPAWTNAGEHQALAEPFITHNSNLDFNHADVKLAYLNYCKRAITYWNPDYFAIGIEVNLLRKFTNRATWLKYLELYQYVYTELKLLHPNLPIFATVYGPSFILEKDIPSDEFNLGGGFYDLQGYVDSQRIALNEVLSHADRYALSIYPHMDSYTSFLTELFSLSSKKIVIAESGVAAENQSIVIGPDTFNITGSPEQQNKWVSQLLNTANKSNVEFIINFVYRDYDPFCQRYPSVCSGYASTWKDNGFYDQDGSSRPALNTWKKYLNRSVRD